MADLGFVRVIAVFVLFVTKKHENSSPLIREAPSYVLELSLG
jgi:hypothetical protein